MTTVQDIFVPCEVGSLANLETRRHWTKGAEKKNEQMATVMVHLRTMATRPRLPCTVFIARVAKHDLDDDNYISALKYVRDQIARWVHNLPDTVMVKLKKGGFRPSKPRAPDGKKDGIAWEYAQERGPVQGVRIVIREAAAPAAALSPEGRKA